MPPEFSRITLLPLLDFLQPVPTFQLLAAQDQGHFEGEAEVRACLLEGKLEEARHHAECRLDKISSEGKARMLLLLAEVHAAWGDYDTAYDLAKQARSDFKSLHAWREEALACIAAARASIAIALSDGSVESAEAEVKEAEVFLSRIDQAMASTLSAEAHLAFCRPREAVAASKTAFEGWKIAGDVLNQAAALRALSLAHLAAGNCDEAANCSSLAAAKARQISDLPGEAAACRLCCEAQLASKDFHQAALLAHAAAGLFAQTADRRREVDALLCAIRAYASRVAHRQATAERNSLLSWAEKALVAADQASKLCRDGPEEAHALLARALALLAFSSLEPSRKQEALAAAESAEVLFTDISDRRGVMKALLTEAKVLHQDDRREAAARLKKARALCGEHEDCSALCDELAKSLEVSSDYPGSTGASFEGLAAVGRSTAWQDHIHLHFSGLQGRAVGNTVRTR